MRAHQRPLQGERGFSILELLVSFAILLTIMTIAFSAFSSARRNFATESGAIEAQQAARISLDELGLTVHQAGYGTTRTVTNRALWQRTIVYGGSHALAFNADIDATLGPIPSSVTLTMPDATTYVGEGAATSSTGAETYVYTLDANGDNSITQADRSAAASGTVNPAAGTSTPLDYALARRVHGWNGTDYGGTITPVTGYLFANATAADDYPDGTSPNPLFLYYLTEDLNADTALHARECVVLPCPPTATRDPVLYLWGDTDFDGTLSESEKDALRTLRVGSPAWSKNRLATSGAYPTTTLVDAVNPTLGAVLRLKVGSATYFAPGEHISLGTGGNLERLVVSQVNTTSSPHELTLTASPVNIHANGDTIVGLEQTFLRAVRAVRINFDAITPMRDIDEATGTEAVGRAGHAGTRGLGYRVRNFERRVDLMNMRAGR